MFGIPRGAAQALVASPILSAAFVPLTGLFMLAGATSAQAACDVFANTTNPVCASNKIDYRAIGDAEVTLSDVTVVETDPAVDAGYITFSQGAITGQANLTFELRGNSVVSSASYYGIALSAQQTGAFGDISAFIGADVHVTSTALDGIWARADDGTVTLINEGTVNAAADGISGTSQNNNASVVNRGTVTASGRGLYADGNYNAGAAGVVSIENSGTVESYLAGARAIGYLGEARITNSGTITSTTKQGLVAWSPNGVVNITNTGTVVAKDDIGIHAMTDDGNVNVTNSGKVTAGNDLSIASAGDSYRGIYAAAGDGAGGGNVTITNTSSGVVTAADDAGVEGMSLDGKVTISNEGTVASGAPAIRSGVAAVVGISQNATAPADGIAVSITNKSSGLVAASTNSDVLRLALLSPKSFSTTEMDLVAVAAGNRAVTAATQTDAAVISNLGTMVGNIAFMAPCEMNDGTCGTLPGATENRFTNQGTLLTAGTSSFSSNLDAASTRIFENSGEVWALGATTFANVGSFNNSGTINLVSLASGSGLTINGNFNALAGSKLVTGFTPSGGAPGKLVITGDVSGTTTVSIGSLVNGTSYDWSSQSRVGVVEVQGATPLGAAHFALGASNYGLRSYALGYEDGATDTWYLTSTANEAASVPLTNVAPNVQSIWYTALGDVGGRLGDLSDRFYGGLSGGGGGFGSGELAYAPTETRNDPIVAALESAATPKQKHGAGTWMKVSGTLGRGDRGGTSYDSQASSIQAGVDGAFDLDGGVLVAGGFVGYVGSTLDYSTTDTSVTATGPTMGTYVAWLDANGFSVEALGAANFANVNATISGENGQFSGRSFGGRLTGSYRYQTGGLTITPTASVAYVRSTFDSLELSGSRIDFGTGESLQAETGVKLSYDTVAGDYLASPFVSAAVGNEFLGDSTVDIAQIGRSVTHGSGVFGRVSTGVNFANAEGNLKSFVRASGRADAHDFSGTAELGLTLNW
ncbi:autotransporter [Youhaiella tibetensis]|uniref:Autotransporter outer membrane beta-barrel domain-containing protein n=1 Tax=Paradevosia tibetensis TaxID=1447062 RepID=A0A5B9DQY1_9HYPH|nr:autotransporter outer membrane beta-barrel domain-containing protein [Youhaiella tibetensis]QEE20784.1 autotransporter outer membrane beta-barrel domain-containing protein [Youhaiella tibetensis]GGF21017.1 autotransporter [Youhaiella tibetensis]